ncbi:MAG: MFS transporter, partial [Dehalococcoidia bacterium]
FRVPKEQVAPAGHPAGRQGSGRGGVGDIAEAFRYHPHQRVLTMLLVVHLFVVLFSMPYQRLLPGFVAEVLAADEKQAATYLGFLLTMTGAGALVGSLVIASIPDRGRGRLLIGSIVVFAAALLAFAASEQIWVSMAIVLVLGFGQAGRQSLSQILIQTHVDDAYRGRISSIMMMEMGLEAFGTFAISLVAVALGAQLAFAFVALGLLAVAIAVAVFLPTYRQLD